MGAEAECERETSFNPPKTEINTSVCVGSPRFFRRRRLNMLAFMEKASFLAVEKYLPGEYSTVGISIQMEHIGAAKKGEYFECESKLIDIKEKKLIFSIIAKSEKRKLASAKHTRYIIHKQNFMNRLND